jgi:TolB-like protein/DNA-binding winged helix-turn-helix (wHTH) protein
MSMPARTGRVVRFGAFEANLSTGELRKHGIKVKLHEQSFRILNILLERSGEVVTREELREALWPTGSQTFVDFENNLNGVVGKLRQALGDSAVQPCFVETLPRRGYRFLAPIQEAAPAAPEPVPEGAIAPQLGTVSRPGGQTQRGRRSFWIAVAVPPLLVASILLFGELARKTPIRSVAVLPLQNLSGNPQLDYFVDGLTDALITDLARLNAVRVTSATSSSRYKGIHKSATQIARQLNVDALLEGSVQLSVSHIRVTVQLVDGRTDGHLWAETFDAEPADILSLESNVAGAVAGRVLGVLNFAEQARLAKPQPVNPEAYDLYLRGRSAFYRYTAEGLEEAIGWYEKAMSQDRSFAPVYAGLGLAYAQYNNLAVSEDPKWLDQAKSLARKAILLQPSLAEGHFALGFALMEEGSWLPAREETTQTLALEPNHARARSNLGYLYENTGLLDLAERESERARQLDPLVLSVYWQLNMVWHARGHYRRALEVIQDSPAKDSQLSSWALARELYELGDASGLDQLLIFGKEKHWSPEAIAGVQALIEHGAGRNLQSRQQLQVIRLGEHTNPRGAGLLASLCATAGDADLALYWLRVAVSNGYANYPLLASGREFEFLRGRPQFQLLLTAVKAKHELYKKTWQ